MSKKRAFVLIFFLALFVIFLPTLLSSSFGNRLCIYLAKPFLKGALSFETLSLSWLGPQKITKLSYENRSYLFTSESILVKGNLFPFSPVEEISISHPSLSYKCPDCYQERPFMHAQMLPFIPSASRIKSCKKITIREGVFIFAKQLQLEGIEGVLVFENKESLSFEVSIKQEKQKTHLFSFSGSIAKNSVVFSADMDFFPTEALCATLSLLHINSPVHLEELLGNTFSLHSDIQISPTETKGSFSFNAQGLKTYFSFTSDDKNIYLTSPGLIQAAIPLNLLWEKTKLPLHTPLNIEMSIHSFTIPLDKAQQVENLSFSAQILSSPYEVLPGVLMTLAVNMDSSSLNAELKGKASLAFASKQGSSSLTLEGNIKNLFTEYNLESVCHFDKISPLLFQYLWDEPHFSLLGDWVEGGWTIQGGKQNLKGFIELCSPTFCLAPVDFQIENKKISLKNGVNFTYSLSPALWKKVATDFPIALTETSLFSVSVDPFTYPSPKEKIKSKLVISPLVFTEGVIPETELSLSYMDLSSVALSLTNPILRFDSLWSYDKKNYILSLKEKLYGKLSLDHRGLIDFCFASATIPLSFDKKKLTAHFEAKAPIFSLENHLSFENTYLLGSFNGKNALAKLIFSAEVGEGKISLKAEGNDILDKEAFNYVGTLRFEKLAVKELEKMFTQKEEFSSFIGTKLDGSLSANYTKKDGAISIDIHSSLLSIKGGLCLKEGSFLVQEPLAIEAHLTPKGYTTLTSYYLDHPLSFTLQKPTEIKALIQKMHIPKKWALSSLSIEAFIENKQAIFSSNLTLQNTFAKISKKENHAPLTWDLATSVEKKGDLTLKGSMDEKANVSIQALGNKMPSSALDILFPVQQNFFSTLLGKEFILKASASLEEGSGPFIFSLSSPKASAFFKGNAFHGTLSLEEKGEISLVFNQDTSSLFLTKNQTPLIQAIAEHPVTLMIDPKGFSFPVHPFAFSKIMAPHIQLNLSKIRCKGDDDFNLALELFQPKKNKQTEVELWFAPLDLHIQKGIVHLERTEILVNNKFDCALWGDVNVPKDSVALTLGITASALKKALGLRGLPSDYVLKIPVKGSLEDFSIDGAYASSKITALVLWKNKVIQKSLGPFGEVLNQVIPPPGDKGPTPPPKHPFPWELN